MGVANASAGRRLTFHRYVPRSTRIRVVSRTSSCSRVRALDRIVPRVQGGKGRRNTTNRERAQNATRTAIRASDITTAVVVVVEFTPSCCGFTSAVCRTVLSVLSRLVSIWWKSFMSPAAMVVVGTAPVLLLVKKTGHQTCSAAGLLRPFVVAPTWMDGVTEREWRGRLSFRVFRRKKTNYLRDSRGTCVFLRPSAVCIRWTRRGRVEHENVGYDFLWCNNKRARVSRAGPQGCPTCATVWLAAPLPIVFADRTHWTPCYPDGDPPVARRNGARRTTERRPARTDEVNEAIMASEIKRQRRESYGKPAARQIRLRHVSVSRGCFDPERVWCHQKMCARFK